MNPIMSVYCLDSLVLHALIMNLEVGIDSVCDQRVPSPSASESSHQPADRGTYARAQWAADHETDPSAETSPGPRPTGTHR